MCELQMNTKFMLFVKETSGHRSFEIKRQLVADVAANNTTRCRKTLKWADQPEAAACMCVCVPPFSPGIGAELVVSTHEAIQAVLDERKSPLLHCAAANGNADLVQLDFKSLFLEYRADVNLTDVETGRTALHEAMYHAHSCAAWALISANACQNKLDKDGRRQREMQGVWGPAARQASVLAFKTFRLEELQRSNKAFEAEVKKRLQNSSELVTLRTTQPAFDGDEAKVLEKLRDWKDPDTENENGRRPLHQ
ncbi:ANKRD50, partial [Symbiodinium pilosum]